VDCPVCGAPDGTCKGYTHYAGPGVVIVPAGVAVPPGSQIASEQIWLPDAAGVLRLAYPIGAVIPEQVCVELKIVGGQLQLRDNADVAPTEKARRRAQDKALRAPVVEDKAEVPDG